MLVNYFDLNSVEAVAEARREEFMRDADQFRREREIRSGRQPGKNPRPLRRAIGLVLIRAGARISGVQVGRIEPVAAC